MKNLRRNFERFCYKHRNKGIPNLMLYVTLGSAVVYLLSMFTGSTLLYEWLCFDRELILQGQVWRLFSYALTFEGGNIVLTAIGLICYYSLGRSMENLWGTLRFNLFYFCGIMLMDIFCLILGGYADVTYLNLSLFLGYATLYPEAHFLLFYIIPVKAWIFAVVDLALTAYDVIVMTSYGWFPYSLFPLVAIANYLLFFGKDVRNVFPMSWRVNAARLFKRKPKKNGSARRTGSVPFPNAGSYQASTARVKEPYNHKCSVCGRTDVSNPELEFRYCSKCKGYHCYCQDHISAHTHVE